MGNYNQIQIDLEVDCISTINIYVKLVKYTYIGTFTLNGGTLPMGQYIQLAGRLTERDPFKLFHCRQFDFGSLCFPFQNQLQIFKESLYRS